MSALLSKHGRWAERHPRLHTTSCCSSWIEWSWYWWWYNGKDIHHDHQQKSGRMKIFQPTCSAYICIGKWERNWAFWNENVHGKLISMSRWIGKEREALEKILVDICSSRSVLRCVYEHRNLSKLGRGRKTNITPIISHVAYQSLPLEQMHVVW